MSSDEYIDIHAKYIEEEIKRDEEISNKFFKGLVKKLRKIIDWEIKKGKEIPSLYKLKYLVSSEEFLRRCFVRISLASLYRRYRQIRLDALTECICIAHQENNKDELIKKIRNKIIEVGEVHKETTKDFKQFKQRKVK